jgi:hypothetical protein
MAGPGTKTEARQQAWRLLGRGLQDYARLKTIEKPFGEQHPVKSFSPV